MIKNFLAEAGRHTQSAAYNLGFNGRFVGLKGRGYFPDDVDYGKIVRNKTVFRSSGSSDFSGIELFEVLSGEGQLQTEQDDEPGDENPQDTERDKTKNTIYLAVGNKLCDIKPETPLGKTPYKGCYRCTQMAALALTLVFGRTKYSRKKATVATM